MRLIPTQVHAAVDVLTGALLVALPWIADFQHNLRLTGICVGTGAAVLVMALLTDYEPSPLRLIPMPIHLLADLVVSVFLIFLAIGVRAGGGGGREWAPLLAIGLAGLLVTLVSDPDRDPDPVAAPAYGTV